jgi:hypothetical protein
MAVHDAYLRRTPFELIFPDSGAADRFVDDVTAQARRADADPGQRQVFLSLPAVAAELRRLQPDEPRPEARVDYAMLLYHAFRFAEAGEPVLLVSEATVRRLVENEEAGGDADDAAPGGTPAVELPAPAGYAQFPRNLFWIQSSPDVPAEAVDGFFWSLGGDGLLRVLLAAGLREDRPGLAVVPIPEAPWADASGWVGVRVRSDGDDFATTLPGGELEGLHSFAVAGEVLKLVARLFASMQASTDVAAAVTEAPLEGGEPPPSTLPYRRI